MEIFTFLPLKKERMNSLQNIAYVGEKQSPGET